MDDSKILTTISVMANEIEMLKFRLECAEEDKKNLSEQLERMKTMVRKLAE